MLNLSTVFVFNNGRSEPLSRQVFNRPLAALIKFSDEPIKVSPSTKRTDQRRLRGNQGSCSWEAKKR